MPTLITSTIARSFRPQPPPSVLLLGVGRLGAEVAQLLDEEGEGKLVGIIARERGTFDARGLSASTVRQLMTYRSPSRLPRLDFPAYDVILAGLARLSWPLVVDCTGADGAELVYAEAGRRGIRVTSAAWLAPRDSLRSAARAMLRVSADRPDRRGAGAA